MPKPKIGVVIKTEGFKTVKILEELGAGGQGTVFKVDYGGQLKALKWYHDRAFDVLVNTGNPSASIRERVVDTHASAEKKKQFRENLKNNIKHGAPSDAFLWPQDITEETHGSFGYIMDLRPPEYIELSKLLLGRKYRFSSYQARVDGMLNLVNAFRVFHNKGFNYQDLNDGNFFFNPNTGDLLVCDNDNAAYAGYKTGIIGKCRFMAPEVVLGQKMPDTMTDRFSMSVVLFFMLFRTHPLEGVRSTPACMTPSNEKKVYGSSPVFVFDPQDSSNRPIRGVSDHAVLIWNRTPQYVKEAFERSFSKGAMTFSLDSSLAAGGKYGASRLIEKEWINVLTRFRNDIVRCSNPKCTREEFFVGTNRKCASCGKLLWISNSLKLPKYEMPIHEGAQVYKVQLGPCADSEALDVVAKVLSKNGSFGIKNVSGDDWHCITSTGAERVLRSGEALPAKPGIRIATLNGSMEII